MIAVTAATSLSHVLSRRRRVATLCERVVDADFVSIQVRITQFLSGGPSIVNVLVVDEAEASRVAGRAVIDELALLNVTKLAEHVAEVLFGGV